MSTITLVPGSFEPEPNEFDVAKGLINLENLANYSERVKNIGSGIITIAEQFTARDIDHITRSVYVAPNKSVPEEISPGVYYF